MPNGPAVGVVNVTWRSHPATGPGSLASEMSRWQARYGAIFARQGRNEVYGVMLNLSWGKNCDKFITLTVRVIKSTFRNYLSDEKKLVDGREKSWCNISI